MANLYPFGFGSAAGGATDKNLLGGKGANLCEMAKGGVPVPPGIVIPTSYSIKYKSLADPAMRSAFCFVLANEVFAHFKRVVSTEFGYMPLVAVRSGARVSMPGMMDTLLNVGITEGNLPDWAERIGGECAVDCAERLNTMYTSTVQAPLPKSYLSQLSGAIEAVFKSWDSERAIEYRKIHGYPDDWGTAVTVQSMVFGNMNAQSGSGVLFTRDPATGENLLTGEFLVNAQGEEVVAGTRTPQPLAEMANWNPALYTQLEQIVRKLESDYADVQDIEFTVQDGQLFVLQTRSAKRSALAAFRIAHDLCKEGAITAADAVRRVTAEQYAVLSRPVIATGFTTPATLTGLPASAGVVSGVAVFDTAAAMKTTGAFILIRAETSPEDFPAMARSAGILTATGGATSHAAVVARGMNKAAVVGATSLSVTGTHALVNGTTVTTVISAGDKITIDGATGRVWVGVNVPVTGGQVPEFVATVLDWAQERANAIRGIPVADAAQLPQSGYVYLSFMRVDTAKRAKSSLKELATRTGLHGIIGLEDLGAVLADDDKDRAFLEFFGDDYHADHAASLEALRAALALKALPKKLKHRWSIHLPRGASSELVQEVKAAGWSVVTDVRSMKDLLAANGLVSLDSEFYAVLQQSNLSFASIEATLKGAGKAVRQMPRVVRAEELHFEMLGK